jgi:hypothetical protein
LVGDLDTLQALAAIHVAGRIHWPKAEDGVRMLKRYLDEMPGVPVQDVITHIEALDNLATERLGCPTQ